MNKAEQYIVMPKNIRRDAQGRDGFISRLIENGVLNDGQAEQIRNKYNTAESLYNGLLNSGYSEEKLTQSYAEYLRVPYTDLKKVDSEVLKTIPERLALKYMIAPFSFNRRFMGVAIALPTRLVDGDLNVLGEIAQRSNVKIKPAFTSRDAINNALSRIGITQNQQNQTGQGFPEVDLTGRQIPADVINLIPKNTAKNYKIIVFEEPAKNNINLGVVNPSDQAVRSAIDFIARENKIKVNEYKISEKSFDEAFRQYGQKDTNNTADNDYLKSAKPVNSQNQSNDYDVNNSNQQVDAQPQVQSGNITLPDPAARGAKIAAAQNSNDTNLDQSLSQEIKSASDIEPFIASGNVPQIISAIIKLASRLKASDIHIEAQKEKVQIRFRIDGVLHDIIFIPNSLQKALVARIKILSRLKIDETRLPQDGRFDVVVDNHDIDMRVSIMPTVFGEKVVLRLLDKNAGLFKIESLGITGENYKRFIKAIEKPYGVVMVTGPTGAGKSTTLYAAINHLYNGTQNIVTLEDPVEYEIPGINQIQIKPNIGFDFADGLRAVLRQDPNIIMVGEIRDGDTANLVTHASLTGHLVLTTLHTNDASGAMPRLINLGVEPFLIASAMNAIVGQRLVRKICPKCGVQVSVPPEVKQQVEKELSVVKDHGPIRFYEGKGCSACGGSGFQGRTGIYEVLEVDDGMEQLIISRAPASKIRDYATSRGMYSMRIDGFEKVIKGITTVDEVMRATAIN